MPKKTKTNVGELAAAALVGAGLMSEFTARRSKAELKAAELASKHLQSQLQEELREHASTCTQLERAQNQLEASNRCLKGARANLRDAEAQIATLETDRSQIGEHALAAATIGQWVYLAARI